MDIKGVYDSFNIRPPHKPNNQIKRTEESTQVQKPIEAGKEDVLNISPLASFQATLATESRRLGATAKINEAATPARIEALKADYQGDNCPISIDKVVDSIIGKVCGTQI